MFLDLESDQVADGILGQVKVRVDHVGVTAQQHNVFLAEVFKRGCGFEEADRLDASLVDTKLEDIEAIVQTDNIVCLLGSCRVFCAILGGRPRLGRVEILFTAATSPLSAFVKFDSRLAQRLTNLFCVQLEIRQCLVRIGVFLQLYLSSGRSG